MSTNKRKEAAALFELIDKSTLKVPKNAGALKIPNWWSSKSNPPTSHAPSSPAIGAPGSLVSRTNESSKPRPVPQSRITPPVPPSSSYTAPTSAAPHTPETSEPTPQHRLFDPPPANAKPSVAPSIRPPTQTPIYASTAKSPASTSPPASASKNDPAPATSKSTEVLPAADLDDLPLPESEPADPSPRRTFAPNTHSQSGKPWSPRRGSNFARLPVWVKLSALAVVVIIVASIVGLVHWLSQGRTTSTAAATSNTTSILNNSSTPPTGSGTGNPPSFSTPSGPIAPANNLPSHNTNNGSPLIKNPGPTNAVPILPTPPQNTTLLPPADYTGTGGGRAFKPGVLKNVRNPDFYYIIVCTTDSSKIAERNAVLLADNGIDISIEAKTSPNGNTLYRIISAQGFPTSRAAETARRKMVEIGHLVPGYKSTQRGWEDAYAVKNP